MCTIESAFWKHASMEGIPELEWRLNAIVSSQLERDMKSINCSNFTCHMWLHTKHLDIDKKKDLYAWCHKNMEV